MTTICCPTTGPIDRETMTSRGTGPRRLFSTAHRASADRLFVYWAVGSCLLVFLALILALVVSGKLRSLTVAVDRHSGEIESLAARVRELEVRATPAMRPAPDSAPARAP
jgi:hypothetical protein